MEQDVGKDTMRCGPEGKRRIWRKSQQVKPPTAKSNELTLIHGTDMIEKTNSHILPSDLYVHPFP